MANVDPFVIQWPQKWTTDPDLRPVLTYLNRFLHDLWVRTGGGGDTVDETTLLAQANRQLISGNDADIGKLQAINNDQAKQISVLIALAQVDRHNIADLISDNGKLRARLNGSDRQQNNLRQQLAGLE